jgi:hypothetical protein
MKLQAKSRLLAFAPPQELTALIRRTMAKALHEVGLKVHPQADEHNTYPTILYFDFESGSWSMSLGEVIDGKAQVFVSTPVDKVNAALRLFTRQKDWSGVEDVNAMVRRCLAVLKKTGLSFYEEDPNVIHKLVSIAGTFPVPKQLKASSQLAYHFTELKNLRKIERQGLKLTKEGQGLWKGSLTYSKPSVFLTLSKAPEVVSHVMGMLLSKRWSLEEWGDFDESKLRAVNAQYCSVTIDLSKVPGAVLHQDELDDDPEFKYITVPVPPEAIVNFFMVEPNWWNA